MTAPLTGAADAPDVPASPMPAAAKPTIKVIRIVISPSMTTAPNPSLVMRSFWRAALDTVFYLGLGDTLIDGCFCAVVTLRCYRALGLGSHCDGRKRQRKKRFKETVPIHDRPQVAQLVMQDARNDQLFRPVKF